MVRVLLDPQALAGYQIDLSDLRRTCRPATSSETTSPSTTGNEEVLVQAGTFLTCPDELRQLVVGLHGGRPVYLGDVATSERGPQQPDAYVRMASGPGAVHTDLDLVGDTPAVTIAWPSRTASMRSPSRRT
jgi:multidrug efflux pump subunit AcrB